MKNIKFRPALIEPILKGEKHSTFRLFDDKNLQVGDIVELLNWETKESFAKAQLIKVYEKPLGHLSSEDFEGHKQYDSTEEMIESFRKYYGDAVTEETLAKVIQFKLL